jgi:discoidin domain receptor family protein 2
MPDGQYNGRFGDLIDESYDGHRSESGFLSGGIGQLLDGIKGHDNYKKNNGYEWIGWRPNQNHISIIFEFSDIRNFTLASFHCNNIFTKDMQVFSSALIYFSLDGRKWSPVPEDFSYMPDHVMERARDVVIHLHHRIGRFIRFDLKFAPQKWILISEVRIDSRPVSRNFLISDFELTRNELGPIATAAINNNRSLIRESVLLIVFSVLGLIITISMVLYIIHTRRRKEKLTGSDYTTMPMKDVATTPLYCEPQDVNRMSPFTGTDPEYAVPDVIGGSPPSTTTFMHPNNPRYYASADVLIRSNINDYDNYHYASTGAKCGAYHVPNNYSDLETNVISVPNPPQTEPPLASLKVPRLSDKDLTVINGQFGYSRFGDCALGHLNNNNNENLVILKTLNNEEFKEEFFAEMSDKWRLSTSCDHFAKLFGFLYNPEFIAMAIEYADCDLKQYLRNSNKNDLE